MWACVSTSRPTKPTVGVLTSETVPRVRWWVVLLVMLLSALKSDQVGLSVPWQADRQMAL
jgi:hypothetical protein